MSRRKALGARHPCDRLVQGNSRTELASPTAIRRLTDQALASVRSAEWASSAGRLYLAGKISASDYASGKRWAALAVSYIESCCAPRSPHTVDFEVGVLGHSADPSSEAGQRRVRHDEKIDAAPDRRWDRERSRQCH